MKNRIPFFGLIALMLPAMALADIVYQGKLVQEWPAEAMPTFDNSRETASAVLLSTLSSPVARISTTAANWSIRAVPSSGPATTKTSAVSSSWNARSSAT